VPADPDDLRYLLALERQGSLLGAARALGVDKATVIRQVEAAEQAMGVPLVARSSRGWSLTPAGSSCAAAAAQIEELLAQVHAGLQAGREAVGVVRLTAPSFFARQFLIPGLGDFHRRWPQVDLRLVTSNALLDLGKREADIGIRNVRPDVGRFVARRLGRLGHAVYAAPTYLERAGAPTREALGGHHLLGYEHRTVYQDELQWLADALPVALRVTDTLTLLEGARAGLGIAVLPCAVGDADAGLVKLDALGKGYDEIGCVYPEELRDAPRLRAVVDWLVELWGRNAAALEGRRTTR
jgi:DNA-binding transcriptional LysR family regulator